jgi:FAD:protein FMN transferase
MPDLAGVIWFSPIEMLTLKESLQPPTSPSAKVFHHSCFAMNTRFSMVLVGIDAGKAEALANCAERELHSCERLMSRFIADSPVSELNRHAGEKAVEPPEALWEILTLCRDYWQRTRGAFDITQWPLNQLWRSHLERGAEPADEAITQARQQAGMHRLDLDSNSHAVRFQSKGMSIDLGGFGKGYALERLANMFRAEGIEKAFLSFGESSVTVLGTHPHGSTWPVGISNMFAPLQTVHTFHLCEASLSSSGTAPYNRMGPARLLGQIINPHTGCPIEGYRTLSVASHSAIEAEVLSTALLVTPEQERASLLSGFSAFSALEIVYQSQDGDFVPHFQWKYGI